MLASFIIIYIIVRTQLNPSLAPLPDVVEDEEINELGEGVIPKIVFGVLAILGVIGVLGWLTGTLEIGAWSAIPLLIVTALGFLMATSAKGQIFLSFWSIVSSGIFAVIFLRWGFFQLTGRNAR